MDSCSFGELVAVGGTVLPLLTLTVIDGDDRTVSPCDGAMPCELGRTVDGSDAELFTLLALVVVPCEVVVPVVVGTVVEVLEVFSVVGGGSEVDVIAGGAGVDEGPSTKAEAAAKSKVVGCMVVKRDNVEVKSRTWGVAEAIEKAQDGNASTPAGKITSE